MFKALKTKGCGGMLPQKIFKQLRSRTCYFLRLGFIELRAGSVGVGVPSLPISLTFSTTQNLKRPVMKRLPNGSRGEGTVTQDKAKTAR